MRVATVLASCLLWVRLAGATPGVIAVERVDVHSEPYDGARVLSGLVAGYPVCVRDETNDQGVNLGVAEPRPGWVALRLPGAGLGYVRREAVQLGTSSATAVRLCGEGAATPAAPAPIGAAGASESQAAFDPARASASSQGLTATPPAAASPFVAGRFLPLDPFRILLGMGSGAAGLNSGVAAQHHIATAGATFNMALGFSLYDVIAVTGTGGAVFPGDHASFSQDVMPLGGGDPSTAQSSLEVQVYSIAVGPRTPFLVLRPGPAGGLVGALFADYGWARVHGIRSIDHCSNCLTEDLTFAGGTFWRIGAELGPVAAGVHNGGLVLSVAYQRYAAVTGLTQELRVGFTCWLL